MAFRNKITVKGSVVGLNPNLEQKITLGYNLEPDTISIVCLLDSVVKITGTVTGNEYTFFGGTPVDVVETDADDILNKKRGKACCGGVGGTSIFELA